MNKDNFVTSSDIVYTIITDITINSNSSLRYEIDYRIQKGYLLRSIVLNNHKMGVFLPCEKDFPTSSILSVVVIPLQDIFETLEEAQQEILIRRAKNNE